MEARAIPTNWRELPFLDLSVAAALLAVSRSQLYRLRDLGEIQFRRSPTLGKTVIPTAEVLRLLETVVPWISSGRSKAAVAPRSRARQARLERTSH